jgi:hypothetical protein
VVFTVKQDRLHEANSVIPLLCVIQAAKFGPSSRQWFTEEARITSEGFYWNEEEQRLMESDDMTTADDDDFSIDSNDSYVTNLTASLNIVPEDNDAGNVLNFDLDFVFNESSSRNQYGDHGSVRTFREDCEQTTRNEREEARKNEQTPSTQKAELLNQSASKEAFAQLLSNDPDQVRQFLSNNPQMFQSAKPAHSSTVSPQNEGADGKS